MPNHIHGILIIDSPDNPYLPNLPHPPKAASPVIETQCYTKTSPVSSDGIKADALSKYARSIPNSHGNPVFMIT